MCALLVIDNEDVRAHAMRKPHAHRSSNSTLDLLNFSAAGGYARTCSVAKHRQTTDRMPAHAAGRNVLTARAFAALWRKGLIRRLPRSNVSMVVHQTAPTWRLNDLQAQLAASWYRCLPTWTHVLWGDDDILDLFAMHGQHDLRYFSRWARAPVMRADLWRYLVLYMYGGLYVDTDYECIGRMAAADALAGHFGAYVVESPNKWLDGETQNSLMASAARHPLWSAVLDRVESTCCDNEFRFDLRATFDPLSALIGTVLHYCTPSLFVRSHFFGTTGGYVIRSTGPAMLSAALRGAPSALRADVRVLPSSAFNGQNLVNTQWARNVNHSNPNDVQRRSDHCAKVRAIHWNRGSWAQETGGGSGTRRTPMGLPEARGRVVLLFAWELAALVVAFQLLCWCSRSSTHR